MIGLHEKKEINQPVRKHRKATGLISKRCHFITNVVDQESEQMITFFINFIFTMCFIEHTQQHQEARGYQKAYNHPLRVHHRHGLPLM